MERIRQAVTGGEQGRGLPKLEEERMRGAGGGGAGASRETGRETWREGGREGGGGRGGGVRPGELPGLEEGREAGWERKEGREGYGGYGGGEGRGYGRAGYGGEGRGYGGEEGWAAEEETGVPAGTRGREKMPVDMTDFWNDWKFGLTYNNEEWGCVRVPRHCSWDVRMLVRLRGLLC